MYTSRRKLEHNLGTQNYTTNPKNVFSTLKRQGNKISHLSKKIKLSFYDLLTKTEMVLNFNCE